MKKKLSQINVGDIFRIGNVEFIKLDQNGDIVTVVTKESIGSSIFGYNSDFARSRLYASLQSFLDSIEGVIGKHNVLEFEVDLQSELNSNLYANFTTKICLPSKELVKQHFRIFAANNIKGWWWLSTPHSTDRVCVCMQDMEFYEAPATYNGFVRPMLQLTPITNVELVQTIQND